MIARVIFLFVILLSAGGCATAPEKGPRFTGLAENRPGYSTLYIFRPHEFIGKAVWPEVFLNQTRVVGLTDSSYTVVYIKPGRYWIRTEKSHFYSGLGNMPGEITVEPDKVHFLLLDRKYDTRPGVPMSEATLLYARWRLTDAREARSEIVRLRFVKPYVDTVEY
ncbi:MAG: DUF2846 domain-containing protein [Syntrophobacteraceae bacterium]